MVCFGADGKFARYAISLFAFYLRIEWEPNGIFLSSSDGYLSNYIV
jgi:hypothetical protein